MTDFTPSRRVALVAGVMTTALLLPILAASPAHAAGATPITDIEFTDGVSTGDEETYRVGTPVSIVLNGSTTGEFQFTGCAALGSYDGSVWSDITFTTASPTTFTWTAGTAMETLLPGFVDLDPESTMQYNIALFVDENNVTPAGTCDDIWNYVDDYSSFQITNGSFTMLEPETMTLTGAVKLGSTVTATAKVPGSLVGDDFDLWACPDQTIYPRDDADAGANGDCYGPIIQDRESDSTQFLLGYDPVRDGESADDQAAAEAAWAEFCGKYFIVHDYQGGGHTNWIGPIDCTVTPKLAATGANDFASAISIGGLVAMLLGGVLLVIRRNRAASIR